MLTIRKRSNDGRRVWRSGRASVVSYSARSLSAFGFRNQITQPTNRHERERESCLSSCCGHSRPCATCTRIMVYIHNKSVPIKDNTEQSDGVQQDREPVCGPESVRVRVCVRDMTYACDACYHDVIACICTSSWHALTCVCVRTCSYESPASGCLPHTRSATCCSVTFLFPGS